MNHSATPKDCYLGWTAPFVPLAMPLAMTHSLQVSFLQLAASP